MKIALDEFEIGPIKTTIGLHRSLLDNSQFVNVEFDIHYIDRMLAEDSL
jgi:biotin carboxylase